MSPVHARVQKAISAMARIGISPETTKPVLKRLWKMYNKEWQLIEEDNYRTLADAIFEAQEENQKAGGNGEMVKADMEPPLKKQHRGNSGNKSLSSKDKGKGIVSTEDAEGPKPLAKKMAVVPQSDSIRPTDELHHRVGRSQNGTEYRGLIDEPDFDSLDHEEKKALVLWSPQSADSSHFGAGSTNPSHDEATAVAKSDLRNVFLNVRDITKGTEKVTISLVDETGNEDLPHFVYCPVNTAYESATVHVSLARIAEEDCCQNCRGDCLMSPIPCECVRSTGGEFAYTKEGLLTQKFLQSLGNRPVTFCQDCPLERPKNPDYPGNCRGHILKMFIKECWRKCGCNMQCGNRVVQRGITRKLEVFFTTTKDKGWGVRTLEELPQGAFICEYAGEILTNTEQYERNTARRCDKGKHAYPVNLDADWPTEKNLKDEEALCLDATNYGNVARFINHRCEDANLIDIPVQVETPDRHYYHVAFFTKRKVDALEELTWDYRIDFEDEDHPIEAFRCRCGSASCRDKGRRSRKRLL